MPYDTWSRNMSRRLVERAPRLNGKTVTPHTLRHGAAMALLHHGVDLSVIALWLGHESSETTQIYLHADKRLKERALSHATPSNAGHSLLAFLESLMIMPHHVNTGIKDSSAPKPFPHSRRGIIRESA